MPRIVHHDKVVKLFIRALQGGARRTSISTCEWAIHGNCRSPWTTDVIGRPRDPGTGTFHESRWHTFTGKAMTMRVTLTTRCRKCDNCRKARSNEWRYRAREELRRAGRSWFGTLTLSPIAHYRMVSEARAYAASRAIPWNSLSDEERFKRVASASLKEVTRYFKRVRKESKVPIRYMAVTERHKSGLPHFHVLLHEVELKPVRHATLSSQWTYGFEKWRLVPFDETLKAANYVTKYISKEAVGRIRASQHYGKTEGLVGPLMSLNRRL